jgi:hypothetical protein
MTTLTSLARAQAVATGMAQPVCTMRHVHLSDRPLVLVPLVLAGEANAPLAALVGDDPAAGRLLVVSQPRNRDRRFAFAAELAEIVVSYVEGYYSSVQTVPGGRGQDERTRFADAPQVLVPNPACIGFVRLLGRSTRFRRPSGEYAVDPAVPVLGRWLSFLAERAEHPGSCLLLAATDVVALHWASGQSPVEDLNLAALMGWVSPPAGMTGAEAASAREDPVTWPPAGPATDPTFDNEVLARLIAACDLPDDDARARHRAESALQAALAAQVAPTWRLMWRAIDLLRGMPPGSRVAARWDADKDAFTSYAGYLRDDGPPQPRRDSAVAAAQRLNWLERAQASYAAQRALDDPLVMAEHRLSGEAFAGPVTAAEPGRLDSSGKRRKLRPLITVVTQDSPRIDQGATLVSPSRPSQQARVISVSAAPLQPGPLQPGPLQPGQVPAQPALVQPGPAQPASPLALAPSPASATAASAPAPAARRPLAVVLELAGGMGRALTPEPGSVPEPGEWLCYTTLTDSYQPQGSFPDRADTPWTHGGPPPEYVPADEDASEAWS